MILKIATYNIQFGAQNIERTAQTIRELADSGVAVFCLQEVFEFNGQRVNIDVITEQLGRGWQWEIFKNPTRDLGVALLWKPAVLQLVKAEPVLLPKLDKFNFYENIFETKIMKIVDAPIQRSALIGTFHLGGKTIRITSIHLDWSGRFAQRRKQLEYFKAQLASSMDCEIICGDLNTMGFGHGDAIKNQAQKNFATYSAPALSALIEKLVPPSATFCSVWTTFL